VPVHAQRGAVFLLPCALQRTSRICAQRAGFEEAELSGVTCTEILQGTRQLYLQARNRSRKWSSLFFKYFFPCFWLCSQLCSALCRGLFYRLVFTIEHAQGSWILLAFRGVCLVYGPCSPVSSLKPVFWLCLLFLECSRETKHQLLAFHFQGV
jgi:hypothetical protein